MSIKTDDNIIVEFSNPGDFAEPIKVFRTLPDCDEEAIGNICMNWTDDDTPMTYECYGIDGEEICPPTTNWIEAEQAFVKYAKHFPHKSDLEKSFENGEVFTWYSGRDREVKEIRKRKAINDKSLDINK